MKLYYLKTPNSRRVCALAKYLKSPVEYIQIDPRKGEQKTAEYLAVNPNGKMPALKDGDVNLWEGPAIMAYLVQKARSDLWPDTTLEQIDMLKWINWDTAHFTRWGNTLVFENSIKQAIGMGEPDPDKVEEARNYHKQFSAVLDNHLKGRNFILGDRLTFVDFCIATVLPSAEQAQLPLGGFEEIARWHDSLMQIDAWRDPWPEA